MSDSSTLDNKNPASKDVVAYPDYLLNPDVHTWGASRDYCGRVRLGGGKLCFDGSPQGSPAWLSQPYYQPPPRQPADDNGYPAYTDEQAIDQLDSDYRHNLPISVICVVTHQEVDFCLNIQNLSDNSF